MSFVHLHVHTQYSLLDGACRIKNLVEKAKSDGMSAIAMTDHGVMYGAVEFYKACKENGIKPIIGCEVYVAPRSRFSKEVGGDVKYYHLVLLCKNKIGYKNLIKMVSLGFTEGFYSKPRIDMELLCEHHEGLVALSACLAGYVPQKILRDEIDEAREEALKMMSIFGDDYYLELQRHGIEEENVVNKALVSLSKELSIGLVATNDVHYIEKEDARTQRVLMCIQTGSTLADSKMSGFEKDEFYLKTQKEMELLFADVKEALENTQKIAEKCNFDFEFDKLFLPAFNPPDGLSPKEYLKEMCLEGLERRLSRYENPPRDEYQCRLDYELSVVDEMGYNEYYLIVHDFISYAKGKSIPVGPGRGSGAGSLAAYCLGITDVDPMVHGLLFERFLNPERVSMPDFDVDFCYFRRQEVIDYVVRKYGKDHVAQIVTFGTLAAKAAIRDVGRVLGMPYSDVDKVAKLIPKEPNITIERALEESRELKELCRDDFKVGSLIEIAKKIEGMPRNTSTHAAGVVITDKAVCEYVPLSMNGDCVVTQYTMNDIASLGLLKIDFLGLRYLTVIHDAVKECGKEISDIPLDDEKTYKLLSDGDTDGVFQLESGGMRSLLVRMAPKNIEDITIAISLYRPGPMDSIPKFLANRKDPSNVKYAHPSLEKILNITNGCIVYQEQVMQIFRALAGYSFGRADIVRRAMSKKKKDVMERERQFFLYGKKDSEGNVEVLGAVNNGVSEEVAKEIYEDMSTFAQYAFNKSHAACYAYLAYYSAYLKCHHPKEYMASLLSSVINSTDKVMEYIGSCKKMGLCVAKPDINTSSVAFSVSNNEIVFGLMAIKNVGESFVSHIIKKRDNTPFASLEDFLIRISDSEINKRMVESLIKAGTLDNLGGKRRSQLLATYSDAIDALQRRNHKNVEGQFDMFSTVDTSDDEDEGLLNIDYPDIKEFSDYELLAMEKEMTGLYLSGHPLERYEKLAKKLRCDKLFEINKAIAENDTKKYRDGRLVTLLGMVSSKKEKLTKSNARMGFVQLEDETGEIELIVFPKIYEENIARLSPGQTVIINGELSVKEKNVENDESDGAEEGKILVRSVFDVNEKALTDVDEKKKTEQNPPETSGKKVKVNLSAFMAKEKKTENADGEKRIPEKPQSFKKLYLKVPGESDRCFSRVQSVLEIYNCGKSEVYIYFDDTKKLVRAVDTLVNVTPTLLRVLCDILGEENVKQK